MFLKQQQQYDENLQTNQFFIEIQTLHSDILQRASQESWIVGIPRLGTFDVDKITDAMIMDHILIPDSEDSRVFYTLSKKELRVENKQLVGVKCKEEEPVRILFEETFYTNSFKCCFLCLEAPLFSEHRQISTLLSSQQLDTLHDCIDFLWSENMGAHLGHIHELCSQFSKDPNEREIEKRVYNLYTKCLETVKEKEKIPCDNLRLAIETYMQNCLNTHLVKLINTLTCHEDAKINKTLRNASSSLQLKDFNHSDEGIIEAKHELAKLNKFNTVLDKVNCLRTTLNCLRPKETYLTSDHILQALVFLIRKIPINNWISNLTYITRFRFSANSSSDETNFITTSFEAALEYIKTNKLTVTEGKQEEEPVFRVVCNGGSLSELSREKCHPLCMCEKCSNPPVFNNINEKGQSLLIAASIHGRLDFVEFLLNSGVSLDLQDFSGRTALHYASMNGYQDILIILVSALPSNVNQKDNDGNTPLHCATLHGHSNCVKALLYSTNNFLDINAVNNKSETALHLATKWNYTEIMKILLENHAKSTIKTKSKETARDLANNYASLRILSDYSNRYDFIHDKKEVKLKESRKSVICQLDHGQRPKTHEQNKKIDLLLKAIENNDLPLTCFYLGFSTKSDYVFGSKCHPLCNCDSCSSDETQEICLPEPISVNMCNHEGVTALHVAAKFGRTEIVRILLDSQAVPCLKTYETLQTPLHLACLNQHVSAVKELVGAMSFVDSRDYKGNTALYYASIGNCVKVVEVLLANGASCEVKNFKGNSVVQEIRDKCLFGMARVLCKERVISSSDAEEYDFL